MSWKMLTTRCNSSDNAINCMNGVFIDDERNPDDVFWINYPGDIEWVVVRSSKDFMTILNHLVFKDLVMSFDHDLQDFDGCGKEHTGYDCLKYLIEFCISSHHPLPECFFHTKNVVGKRNMEAYYQNALKHTSERYKR